MCSTDVIIWEMTKQKDYIVPNTAEQLKEWDGGAFSNWRKARA
jgi:hypothetical protein